MKMNGREELHAVEEKTALHAERSEEGEVRGRRNPTSAATTRKTGDGRSRGVALGAQKWSCAMRRNTDAW